MSAWNDLPPVWRARIQSYTVSSVYSAWSIVIAMASVNLPAIVDSPQSAWHVLATHWWGVVIGIVFGIGPYVRAHQGATAAQNVPPSPPSQGVNP